MKIPADIHTHILPGMDDGSKTPDESVRMLRMEAQQNIPLVALTPHFYASENAPEQFLERRQAAWERLRPRLEPGMPRTVLGAEVQYFEGIAGAEGVEKLCIGQTGLLLLEMPFSRWPERVIREMMDLNDRGIRVILAHIDRYFSTQPGAMWKRMYANGVLMQLNAEAFLRMRSRHLARRLFAAGMVPFLGSDCHNLQDRAPNLGRIESAVSPHAEFLADLLQGGG